MTVIPLIIRHLIERLNMASLMQTFEQQYSVLSADITVKVGKVPNLHGGEKLGLIGDIEHQIDEVQCIS